MFYWVFRLSPGSGATFGRGPTVDFFVVLFRGLDSVGQYSIGTSFHRCQWEIEECSFLSFGLLLAVAWHFGVGAAPKIYLIDPASMETGEILRRFFPLRSHLQVFMSTVGVATRHCLWSLKSVMVSQNVPIKPVVLVTCTFWMVNFQTFKGRWGIPNICYIIFNKGIRHFVSKRIRKWLLCQAKLPNGGKHESW